jgi:hypothetical protein
MNEKVDLIHLKFIFLKNYDASNWILIPNIASESNLRDERIFEYNNYYELCFIAWHQTNTRKNINFHLYKFVFFPEITFWNFESNEVIQFCPTSGFDFLHHVLQNFAQQDRVALGDDRPGWSLRDFHLKKSFSLIFRF